VVIVPTHDEQLQRLECYFKPVELTIA